MLSADLIASPAWRARSIHCVRLLDRLELENCAHAGKENGYLIVTYDQFVAYGIGRRFVRRAIEEAVKLGLAKVTRQGLYRGAARRQPPVSADLPQVEACPWNWRTILSRADSRMARLYRQNETAKIELIVHHG
jgi:hypothetical protein